MQLDSSTGSKTYLQDHMGSTSQLVDSLNANAKARYDYKSYGKLEGDVSNPSLSNAFTYTGREDDGTGLMYYRARYYDPELEVFISPDPLGDAQRYVGGNPLSFVDPLGLDAWNNVLSDWFFEQGSANRTYDASHQITQDLMNQEGVQRARAAWISAGKPNNSAPYFIGFGVKDYFRELAQLDGTGSFLGSYIVNITSCSNGQVRFDVYNTTGWESGTRMPPQFGGHFDSSIEDILFHGAAFNGRIKSILNDRQRADFGPGGNFKQHYFWYEKR